mgnify:CR=1 FL=1
MITFGGKPLSPAEVESPYIIRVAIALLMVAASIEGRSVIRHAAPIRRAHPHVRREPGRRSARASSGASREPPALCSAVVRSPLLKRVQCGQRGAGRIEGTNR